MALDGWAGDHKQGALILTLGFRRLALIVDHVIRFVQLAFSTDANAHMVQAMPRSSINYTQFSASGALLLLRSAASFGGETQPLHQSCAYLPLAIACCMRWAEHTPLTAVRRVLDL